MPVLEIQHLTKRYGNITAVDDLSLEVNAGEIFGILGPNGSGKTTTLGIILGIINKNAGQYRWFDGDYAQDHMARRQIGALLETPNFYPYLNALDNLKIVAHIKRAKQPDFERALKLVNLYERRKYAFKTYSLGMKQRLAIAAAMIGDPKVLIFDEPTNGLDPQGIAEVRDTIRAIAEEGKTILMASHILDEVEKVCSHVAIIKKGVLLASGTVGSIISDQIQVELAAEKNVDLLQLLKQQDFISEIQQENGILRIMVDEDFSVAQLNALAYQNGITLTHLVRKKRSLESEFLEITGN